MNWKKIREFVWFALVFVAAIKLIEYPIDEFFAAVAADTFGALALMFVAVTKTLEE